MTLVDRIEALAGVVSGREIAAGKFPWLTEQLVPTPHAAARLRRWAAAGLPSPDYEALAVVGAEPALRRLVDREVHRLPPPVGYHVVRNVLVVVVGRVSGGWVEHAPMLPAADESTIVVTVADVGGDDVETAAVFAHEVAHAWLSRPVLSVAPSPASSRAAVEDADLIESVAREWSMVSPRAVPVALDEWRVAALARSWGFVGGATDTQRFGRELAAARRRVQTSALSESESGSV